MRTSVQRHQWERSRAALVASCLVLVGSQWTMPLRAQEAVVYLDSTRQVIRGFGAANIMPWRPDMTSDNIQKAFGTGDGQMGFSLLRLRIPPSAGEFALNVPTAQAALGMGVKIIASPWSPPAEMKTNSNIVGGSLHDTAYASYAAHLRSFYDYMLGNGVPLYAISVQNEPDISVTYESCDWNATQMVKFLQEQGSTLGTKVIAPESFQFRPEIANAILNDSAATANVSIIGGHIYGAGLSAYPLAASKGKEHWMTEHLELDTSWTAVLGTGSEMHNCMNAGMNAYIWWYIVRYYGPIHEDGFVTKRGYVMSHFSRFIRPGSTKVLTYTPRGGVPMTAYRQGPKVVIVVVNTGASTQQSIRVENMTIPGGHGSIAAVTPYVTSSTKNCVEGGVINALNGTFSVTLDSSSITTLVGNVVSDVGEEQQDLPGTVELGQNYPNPFNPSTTIRYTLPAASFVSLRVFDMLGREVASLVHGMKEAGAHAVEWHPQASASGMYVYRLESTALDNALKRTVESRRMLYLR